MTHGSLLYAASLSGKSVGIGDSNTKVTVFYASPHSHLTRFRNFHRRFKLNDGKLAAMNEHKSGRRDFKADYALLELNHRADWKTVRAKYRHLVHLWHPDRFAQRPRERVHAQTQFIALTQSYTRLKAFQRQHGRLPFEPIKARTHDGIRATSTPGKKTSDDRTGQHDRSDVNITDTTIDDIEPGILGRKSGTGTASMSKSRSSTRVIWILLGCFAILATLSVFFFLDRKANLEIMERGREAVRDAPASDFMPSASEIRKSEAKGAFVQPTK